MSDMEDFQNAIRKRLSLQHRGKNIIGSIALNEVKAYFNIVDSATNENDKVLIWYVRNNKLFLKTADQQLKIQTFQKKNIILWIVNDKLSELWYSIRIQDVFFK